MSNHVTPAVTGGLFIAWLANDIEELLTMGPWSQRHAADLREMLPFEPPWGPDGMSEKHVQLSITIVGAAMLAASVEGIRTGGRSAAFQSVLWGFGVHGVAHLLQSIAFRGYTPGVLTTPLVVLPYSGWAFRQLHSARALRGLPDPKTWIGVAIGLPAALIGVHVLTDALLGHPRG